MFLLMTVLVLIMNLVNYYEVISESDQIMEILSQPGVPRQTASHSPAQAQLQNESMDFIKAPTIVLQVFTLSHEWLYYP